MDSKTLTVTVLALLLTNGFVTGILGMGLSGFRLTGDQERGTTFRVQAAIEVSGETTAAGLHTISAQVRGGLNPFFKKKLMIASMLPQATLISWMLTDSILSNSSHSHRRLC